MQCSTEDRMKDICQKFATKVQKSVNSLIFLYGGSQLDFNLKVSEQANSLDKERKEMKILVFTDVANGFLCPKCGERIKLNTEKIDNIISSIINIKDTLGGAKLLIENIIKNSIENSVNMQLKSVNLILNSINEDIQKTNEKLKNLLNENETNINKFKNINIIKGELYIKQEEINDKIALFNTDINDGIDVFLNNKKINMIKDNNKWIIDYHFDDYGKYSFEININNNITNLNRFFEDCSNIISLDVSYLDTSNVTNMYRMFHNCNQLKEIKGLNKFNTSKVLTMKAMFQLCSKLEYLDLSNFDTSNVTEMGGMFNGCNKLKEIKGINKFITNKVNDMSAMFQECNELKYLDLFNFNTKNVTNMSYMFNKCNKLEYLNIINFDTKNVINMSCMFNKCNKLEYLIIINFDTSNANDMRWMFNECYKLKEIEGINKFITTKSININMNQNNSNVYNNNTNNFGINNFSLNVNSNNISSNCNYNDNMNNNNMSFNNNYNNNIRINNPLLISSPISSFGQAIIISGKGPGIPPPPPPPQEVPIAPIKMLENKSSKIGVNSKEQGLSMAEQIANFKFKKKSKVKTNEAPKPKPLSPNDLLKHQIMLRFKNLKMDIEKNVESGSDEESEED